jgi:hypothetical protein
MKTAEGHSPNLDHEATVGKLLYLGILGMGLCLSVVLNFLTPALLVLLILTFGRLKALAVGVVSVAVLGTISVMTGFPEFFAGSYFLSLVFAFIAAEIIFRNINPVKGLIYSGLVVILLSGSAIVAYDRLAKTTLKEQISAPLAKMVAELKKEKAKQQLAVEEEKNAQQVITTLENYSNNFYATIPSALFLVSYFGLWISLYVALRNTKVWRYKVVYSYSLRDLILFKVPDFFVYPLILALALVVGADYGLPKGSEMVGENLLYFVGVLYLIQGFGVYSDFLKYLRIQRWIKVLFIGFTLMAAPAFMAILGVVDLWFDFRKFFTNTKKNEGDTI